MVDNLLDNLVFDIGSHTSKAGWARDASPSLLFPTLVAAAAPSSSPSSPATAALVGDDIPRSLLHRGAAAATPLDLRRPVQYGVVARFDDYQHVCAHAFDKLRADPTMHSVLVAEAAGVPASVSAAQREEVAEIMFEGFGVPSLCTANGPLLALLSLGEATGVVLDAGHQAVSVTPVWRGRVVGGAAGAREVGGCSVTERLAALLRERGLGARPLALVEGMKEAHAFVSADYHSELLASHASRPRPRWTTPGATSQPPSSSTAAATRSPFVARSSGKTPSRGPGAGIGASSCSTPRHGRALSSYTTPRQGRAAHTQAYRTPGSTSGAVRSQSKREKVVYHLPDGQTLEIGSERFECAEILFQPKLLRIHHKDSASAIMHEPDEEQRAGADAVGVHILVRDAILACHPSMQSELAGNIVLAGGTTMLSGFASRLQKELTKLSPSSWKVKVHKSEPSRRLYRAWSGGALVASLPLFSTLSVSKEMYEERGAAVAHPWTLRSRVPPHALAQLLHPAQSRPPLACQLETDATPWATESTPLMHRRGSHSHSVPSLATRKKRGGSAGSAELGWWATEGHQDIAASASSASSQRTGHTENWQVGREESGAAPLICDAVHPEDDSPPQWRMNVFDGSPVVCPQQPSNLAPSLPTKDESDMIGADRCRGFHSPIPVARSVCGKSSEASELTEHNPRPRDRASSSATPNQHREVSFLATGSVGDKVRRTTRLALSADQAKMLLSPGLPDVRPEEAALQRAWQGEWFRGKQSPCADSSGSVVGFGEAGDAWLGGECKVAPPPVDGAQSPEEIVRRIHELLDMPGTVPEPARWSPFTSLLAASRFPAYAGATCRVCNHVVETGSAEDAPNSAQSSVSTEAGGKDGGAIGDEASLASSHSLEQFGQNSRSVLSSIATSASAAGPVHVRVSLGALMEGKGDVETPPSEGASQDQNPFPGHQNAEQQADRELHAVHLHQAPCAEPATLETAGSQQEELHKRGCISTPTKSALRALLGRISGQADEHSSTVDKDINMPLDFQSLWAQVRNGRSAFESEEYVHDALDIDDVSEIRGNHLSGEPEMSVEQTPYDNDADVASPVSAGDLMPPPKMDLPSQQHSHESGACAMCVHVQSIPKSTSFNGSALVTNQLVDVNQSISTNQQFMQRVPEYFDSREEHVLLAQELTYSVQETTPSRWNHVKLRSFGDTIQSSNFDHTCNYSSESLYHRLDKLEAGLVFKQATGLGERLESIGASPIAKAACLLIQAEMCAKWREK